MASTGMSFRAMSLRADEPCPVASHAPDVPPVSPDRRVLDRADRHLMLFDEDGRLVARCSCWWTTVPPFEGRPLGAIGHYAAADIPSGTAILRDACVELAAAGCACVAGPMDGSTWRSYRLVTDPGTEPPFFLEPWMPASWRDHWALAGFEPLAHYSSAVADDLSIVDPRLDRARVRLASRGIVLRRLAAGDPERDLRRILALSLDSFRRNFLYAPIGEAEFLQQIRPVLPAVRPELVLLAESKDPGDPLYGFLFAVPDVLLARRGAPVDTVVIKTVAVASGPATSGLGSVLVAEAHRIARELGYRRAIHALMHDRNVSRNISRRYARTIRRYALLGRSL